MAKKKKKVVRKPASFDRGSRVIQPDKPEVKRAKIPENKNLLGQEKKMIKDAEEKMKKKTKPQKINMDYATYDRLGVDAPMGKENMIIGVRSGETVEAAKKRLLKKKKKSKK